MFQLSTSNFHPLKRMRARFYVVQPRVFTTPLGRSCWCPATLDASKGEASISTVPPLDDPDYWVPCPLSALALLLATI